MKIDLHNYKREFFLFSEMEDPEGRSFTKTAQILEDVGIEDVTVEDCANVAYVCKLISTRLALSQKFKSHFQNSNIIFNFWPLYSSLQLHKTAESLTSQCKCF